MASDQEATKVVVIFFKFIAGILDDRHISLQCPFSMSKKVKHAHNVHSAS